MRKGWWCSTRNSNNKKPRDTTGNGGSGGGTGGDTTVVVADIGNLKQNHIKAGSTYLDRLYITDIGGYNSGGQDYFTLHMTGENNFLIVFTIKGSSLREGNFSLKKFRLGSSPGDNEAVMYVSIDGNLMDFESTDNKSISIKLDNNGFYVIKMAPIVGTNRNSWDVVITDPISVHVVTNHDKITTTNPTGDTFDNDKYSFRNILHHRSNQPKEEIIISPITVSFIDYDFTTTNSIAKTTYPLSTTGTSVLQQQMGTVAQGVYMSYTEGFTAWNHRLTGNQSIEMELTPKIIIITFSNIVFEDPSDSTQTKTASGQWELAR